MSQERIPGEGPGQSLSETLSELEKGTKRQETALVVFSGGQDSTTCLYYAKARFERVLAITFDYGQRHRIELESAERIADIASVDHRILEIGPVLAGISTLTSTSGCIPTKEEEALSGNSLPSTFVPGRNIIFLAIASSVAYKADCSSIVCGVSQEDYSGYPDCREDFINSMQSSLSLGLDRSVEIVAPLMHLSKADTVRLALNLDGCMEAMAYSTTCYRGESPPCGVCNSCVLRQRGFENAGVEDPLRTRTANVKTSHYDEHASGLGISKAGEL